MTDLAKFLQGFENDNCGGYHGYLYDDETGEEDYIGDHVEEALKNNGITKYVMTDTYAFDSPGLDVSILSVAYEDADGILRLETFGLRSC